MRTIIKSTMILFGILTFITGGVYPIIITAIAQMTFPQQANGSLMVVEGRVVGSELIGQTFDDPIYFWGRQSATSGMPYNAASSGASNRAPSNPALITEVNKSMRRFTSREPSLSRSIPIDLITTSGSGLDPHISIDAARVQIRRVAEARAMDEKVIEALIVRYTESRQLGFLGEPRVNVLKINLALDEIQ